MDEGAIRLKKFLATLPSTQNYGFTEKTRRHMRRQLYLSATSDGKYLHELFKDKRYTANTAWDDADDSQLDLKWVVHDHKMSDPSHPNRPCARKFRIGEPIYRCLTCGLDDTCALCSDCFKPEDHEGHQLYKNTCQRENGGVCDCGDPEAWTVSLKCQYFKSNIIESELADDFHESLLRTLEVLLDYIIDVMVNANLMYSKLPQTPFIIKKYSDSSTLLSSKYGAEDINSQKYALILYNDQVRQQQDAIRRIHLATGKVKDYATMITREVEAYGKAIVLISDDLDLLIERQSIMSTTGFNTAIRSLRDIFREESCDEAIKWIEDITSSTIFEKYEGFRDLVCKAFVKKWESGVGTDQFNPGVYKPGSLDQFNYIPVIQDSEARVHPKYWDFQYTAWSLPVDLCDEIQYNDDSMVHDKNEGRNFLGSRLQYLLFMDIRFWKSIRLVLHDLYIYVLISNLKFKQIINCQYVDIYPQVAEMFLSTDREAESSAMCSLSTQLFTCPSNATTIIKHGSITRFLAVFYSFITKNVVESPNSVDTGQELNFANLKNRKWCQLFFDMSYIISRNEQVDLIFGENVLNQIIDVLLLFQGSPTLKRSPIEHVEYESSDYTIYFHAISILSHFVEGIARCTNKFSDSPTHRNLVEIAINLVICRIGNHINSPRAAVSAQGQISSLSLCDVDLEPPRFKLIGEPPLKIIDFKVSEQSVSFIHSLHAFLSWLIELNKFFKNDSQLEPIFLKYFSFDPNAGGSSCYSLQLFDYPLRTLVLLSQIKVGFWVRNGFSVRTQMQIYRKSTIRDGGYSRDLYLTQCFASSLPESVTTATFFDRWELMPWIEEDVSASVYGRETTPLMVEEFVLFAINILTDDSHLKQLTGDKVNESRITKEIICALCFKPLSYSELAKEVPDHIAAEKKFEYILDIVADLIPPKSFNEVGIYKLKEKYFDEIDPFFVHYTSNKRDEAIDVLKKRIHKKTGKPINEICLEPNVIHLNEENGIYQKIPRFTSDVLFTKFLKSTLKYINLKGVERNDTLLELTLYLIHICCIYDYEGKFNQYFLGISINETVDHMDDYPIASLLYDILLQEQYKLHHIKIRVIFQLVIQKTKPEIYEFATKSYMKNFDPEVLSSSSREAFLDSATQLEKKKKAASKRKIKILQKFKKQQEQFLANNDSDLFEQSDSEMFDEVQEKDINGAFWSYPEEHCILCQMHKEGEPFGTVGCVSSSPEFRHIPFNDPYWFIKSFSDNENLDHDNIDFGSDERYSERWHEFMAAKREEAVIGPAFPHTGGLIEDHHIISSCSHGMHYSCFLQYFKDTRKRATQITRKLPEDFDKQEFLCPLCKSLNNCFIPIMAQSNRASLNDYMTPEDEVSGNDWYLKLQNISKVDFQKLKDSYVADAIISSKVDLIPNYYQALFVNPDRERKMHTSIMHSLASSLGLIGNIGDILQTPNIESILLHTIESVESSLRGVPHKGHANGIVINQLTNQLLTTLRVFSNFRDTVELMNAYTSCKREKKGPDEESSNFISAVEQTLGKISLLGNPDDLVDLLLSTNFFEMLLEVEGAKHLDIRANSILRTCFLSQVLQNCYLLMFKVISGFDLLEECISVLPVVETGLNVQNAREVFRGIERHIYSNYKVRNENFEALLSNDDFICQLYSMVIRITTPFLRKCAIFCYVKCANTKDINFENFELEVIECERLCKFLRIPSINTVFGEYLHQGTVENTIYTKLITKEPSLLLPLASYNIDYPGLVSLAELPERLDDFFTKLYYPMNLCHIKNPAICLHCCAILDMQNLSLDSQKGECYQHYKQHCFNDDNGIFLLPKNTRLLLIHEDNGSFHDAPYVDVHYELDKEGNHGHVMYLSKERYANFVRSVWLGHDVSNFITRALENNIDVGGWETL